MNKKNLFFISLLTTQLLTADVLIIPYAYDQGVLKFLLARHTATKSWKGFWGNNDQEAIAQAQQLNIPLKKANFSFTTPEIHFEQISYIPGSKIFTKAKLTKTSQPINDVAWVPLSELLAGKITSKNAVIAKQLNTAVQQHQAALQQHFSALTTPADTSASMIQKTLSYGPWPQVDPSSYQAFSPIKGSHLGGHATNQKYISMAQEVWPTLTNNAQTLSTFYSKNNDPIFFYESALPFAEFTNLIAAPIFVEDGHGDTDLWQSSEHYFQAHKFAAHDGIPQDPRYTIVKNASVGKAVFTAGQLSQTADKARIDWWNTINLHYMLQALWAKFTQLDHFRDLLIGQKPSANLPGFLIPQTSIIIENALKNDGNWGNGSQGQGLNHLGQMLMFIRARLLHQILPDEKYVWRTPSALKQWVAGLPKPGTHATVIIPTNPNDIFKLAEALQILAGA